MQRVNCLGRLVSTLLLNSGPRCGVCSVFYRQQFQFDSRRGIHRSPFAMSYSIAERGKPNTLEYRLFLKNKEGNVVSPFHDVPLYADKEKKIFNMVVEIPRWTNSKMEICKEEKMNPIKQDVKKGKLRYVKNVFPHHGYIWNYGAFPQTWEDPNHTTPETNTKGDNDPLDVCEIGFKVHPRGSVIQVKVLGTMCLIDEGETDWKIICIDVTDPLAESLNDIDDVEKCMPGFIKATNEWFKIYKMPDDKPPNKFAFNGDAKNKAFALDVIDVCNKQWESLIGKKVENLNNACENISVGGSPYNISTSEANSIADSQPPSGPPESVDQDVNKWHYVKL